MNKVEPGSPEIPIEPTTKADWALRVSQRAIEWLNKRDWIKWFTFGLVLVGGLQGWILHQQGALMDIEGRPWVGLDHIADDGMKADQKLTIFAVLRNSGGTPGLHVKACVGSKVLEAYETDKTGIAKMMDTLSTCAHVSSFYILPNTLSWLDISRKKEQMTQQIVTDLATGVEVLAAFGKVTYDTADGQKHWSTFCDVFVPSGDFFHACEYGNDAK